MESAVIVAVLIGLIVVAAFVYEFGRRLYYRVAAKIFGWSEHEKFLRSTAWIDRAVEKDQRLAKQDSRAAVNTDRRRMGVTISTAAVIAPLIGHFSLPWWEVGLVAVALYAGLTMAAGLAWKWW